MVYFRILFMLAIGITLSGAAPPAEIHHKTANIEEHEGVLETLEGIFDKNNHPEHLHSEIDSGGPIENHGHHGNYHHHIIENPSYHGCDHEYDHGHIENGDSKGSHHYVDDRYGGGHFGSEIDHHEIGHYGNGHYDSDHIDHYGNDHYDGDHHYGEGHHFSGHHEYGNHDGYPVPHHGTYGFR